MELSRIGPILTLEPLMEGVREGGVHAGWELSGLQKTSSREFEGRWAGQTSRSAYLLFRRSDLPPTVAVESFLDETCRGLEGNLSLVLDGPRLREVGSVQTVMERLSTAMVETLPRGFRTPLSTRVQLNDPACPPGEGEVQVRIRFSLPRAFLQGGVPALADRVAETIAHFERLLERPEVAELLPPVLD
jgi:hypothetical protein